ncbi:MAG: LLM class flavin-dependent oxidoreductase [Gammaproteobacteria bacterium]|nr:LLM class flavin-dependent oxidoreductase [Gammaproteobacteria bacterium]
MRIGVSFIGAKPTGVVTRERMTEDASLAESIGFDSLWFFDALGRGMMLPDPLIALTVAALVTEHIEVGTCILQVPLRRPAELAQRVLTAQAATDGRFAFGVGAGSTRTDFTLTGVDFASRMQAMDESIQTMRKLWRGEQINGVSLHPPANVRGGPPLLIGSWSGAQWIPRAAREFDGWIASGARSSVSALHSGIEVFRREGGKRAIVTNIPCHLNAASEPLTDDGPFHVRCGESEGRERMARLAELGYDDAVFMVPDRDPKHLQRLRDLVT